MKRYYKAAVWVLFLLISGVVSAQPAFIGTINKVPKSWQRKMIGRSWKPGCPVAIAELAYLKLSYWGYDNRSHVGTLIINRKLALEVVAIFKEMYMHHFPLQEMKPYATYPVGKYAEYNDTVGFYCRPAQDKPSTFSSHAYGIAIDINPLVNPFRDLIAKDIWPKGGDKYMNRQLSGVSGVIKVGDVTFKAFTSHGWRWGGFWQKGTDYMHFQKMMNANYVVVKMQHRETNVNPKLPEN